MLTRLIVAVALGLVAFGASVIAQTSIPTNPLRGAALLEALRGGGFVIYFRHTRTLMEQTAREDASRIQVLGLQDRAMLENCELQRLLSDAGREDARRLGADFRNLRISVGRVIASPFCRIQEHAKISFGYGGRVETNWDLFDSGSLPEGGAERNRLRDALIQLLGTVPAAGTNTVIVAHRPNFNDLTGITLDEGEGVVFRPLGNGRFELVARVLVDRWAGLAR